jgi:hypothetical protein
MAAEQNGRSCEEATMSTKKRDVESLCWSKEGGETLKEGALKATRESKRHGGEWVVAWG